MEREILNGVLVRVSGLNFNTNWEEVFADIEEIGDNVFEDCPYISHLVIPSNIKAIGSNAFKHCMLLQEITLPKEVEKIGEHAFAECRILRRVQYYSTTQFGYRCFEKCPDIETLQDEDTETRLFFFPLNQQYAITVFNKELSDDEYQIYTGRFADMDYFPNGKINTNNDLQYFAVIQKNNKIFSWFNSEIELAKMGAKFAASGKSCQEFFGKTFTEDTIVNWDELALLLGVCNNGRSVWKILCTVYNQDVDRGVRIGTILRITKNEWPLIYFRLKRIIDQQDKDFHYINYDNMISEDELKNNLKNLIFKYHIRPID